jgi:hypothetical protein
VGEDFAPFTSHTRTDPTKSVTTVLEDRWADFDQMSNEMNRGVDDCEEGLRQDGRCPVAMVILLVVMVLFFVKLKEARADAPEWV